MAARYRLQRMENQVEAAHAQLALQGRRAMTGIVALKAAYAVTWVIEFGYIWYLLGRYRRVRKEMKDLEAVHVRRKRERESAAPFESLRRPISSLRRCS